MSKPKQTSLPLMGAIDSKMVPVDSRLVAMCDTEQAAFRLCVNQARVRRTQESIAELMGMTKGALNTVLNSDQSERKRHMSRVQQISLQRICGNTAIDQWADLYEKGLLDCQRDVDDELARLEAEVARLRERRMAS